MTKRFVQKKFSRAIIGLAFMASASGLLNAQSPPTQAPEPNAIEQSIADISDDTSLDETLRDALLERYQQALKSLDQAETFQKNTAKFQKILKSGAEQTTQLRAELESLQKNIESGEALKLSDEARQQPETTLASKDTELAALRSALNEHLATIESATRRPDAIRESLTAIEQALVTTRKSLNNINPDDQADKAKAAQALAEITQLEAEAQALNAELQAQPIYQPLLEVQKTLLEAKIEHSSRRIEKLNTLITKRQRAEVKTAQDLLQELRQRHPQLPDPLVEPVRQLEDLSDSLKEIGGNTKKIEQQQTYRQRQLNSLREHFDTYRKLLELGNLEGEFAEMFLKELRQLPTQRQLNYRIANLSEQIATTRQKLYLLEDIQITSDLATHGPALESEFNDLQEIRQSVKNKLEYSYQRLIFLLTELEQTERAYAKTVSEFRAYATGKLFWVRSSPALNADSFRSVPAGLAYCLQLKHWREFGQIIAATPLILALPFVLIIIALLVTRKKIVRALVRSGKANQKISSNRFLNTLQALGLTTLLAIPAPLALSGLIISLGWQGNPSHWIQGLRTGFIHGAVFLLVASLIIATCRSNGLGEIHFQWPRAMLRRSRVATRLACLFYLPCVIILGLVFAENDSQFLNGLGRWTVLALVVSHGLILAYLLHHQNGLIAWTHQQNPDSRLGRTKKLWPTFIYLLTALIFLLVLLGYIITAVMLVQQFSYVILSCLGAIAFYALCVRWFSINERRLAFEQAVAERRARLDKAHESKKSDEPSSQSSDEALVEETLEEEEEKNGEGFNLSRVNDHSRRLLRFVTGVALLSALYFIWTGFGPVTEALNQFTIGSSLTVRDIFLTLIVITLTVSTVRNLPGLLEGLVLSKTSLSSGGRHTAITLCQYLITAIGATVLFQNLGIDWAKFAWIAAALSVGIGFGLQEIVANFISGLIILFERPIRVGDVVTVDGIDGVVSKIQIRATTITGWNRKEFIVPNKNFITGTLLNWTLTNTINRAEISVGVAYGSDTQKACSLLLEVAHANPNILADPPPLATFDQFGDSTLNLTLRAYIPNMEDRLSTISELHTAIDQKFKDAGIEIAFPQLDLHMKK